MRIRILVADDEQDVRDYLARMVTELGYLLVGCADNGRQLVELARSMRPDLIITDVHMPELTGDEAIREIARHQSVATVFVTAYLPETQGPLPPHILLHKPISRGNLAAAIREAIHPQSDTPSMRRERT